VERATDSALHGRVELPFKAAIETTERVPGIGMLLANNIVGQFVVFNEHEAIVDFSELKPCCNWEPLRCHYRLIA
jgi:hypothetical protein